MTRHHTLISVFALAALCSLNASAATLTGTSVTSAFYGPTFFDPLPTLRGTQTSTVGAGAEITCPGSFGVCGVLLDSFSVDFDAATISFQQRFEGISGEYSPADFNGWVFSGLNFETGITGVTLDSYGFTGLDASRLSFTTNSVTLNLQGLGIAPSSGWTLTLGPTVTQSVPEPGSLALIGLGLALGAASMRSRKRF